MERAVMSLFFYCVFFLRVERDLGLLCYIFSALNAIWRHCIILYACGEPPHGTRSGVIVLYFPRVEGQ